MACSAIVPPDLSFLTPLIVIPRPWPRKLLRRSRRSAKYRYIDGPELCNLPYYKNLREWRSSFLGHGLGMTISGVGQGEGMDYPSFEFPTPIATILNPLT